MILPKTFAAYVTPALRYNLLETPEFTDAVILMQVHVFTRAGTTTISDELVTFVVEAEFVP